MIFIAKNHNLIPIGIISAKSKELANAYFQGKEIYPYQITEFDMNQDRENEKMGFVTPILATREVDSRELLDDKGREYIVVINN